ncbi:MAG: HD domain-containing protein [Christensenellales bacterium]
MPDKARVALAMVNYYKGQPKRINHFIKVHGFAAAIGRLEGLDEAAQEILEVAALTHDIGILPSERKYGSSAGGYQQTEGPPEAQKMLESLGYPEQIVRRVCWLIAHHHEYADIRGMDYQILVEADFLVNIHEGEMSESAAAGIRQKIFRTRAGKEMFDCLFG